MLLFARYVLPVSEPHIENGAVKISENKIVDIGSANELRAKYPNEEQRDFGLAAIMPGFVDVHTHLEYSAFRGLVIDARYPNWRIEVAKLSQCFSLEDWYDSALLGAMEAARSGITTMADITDTGASLIAAKDIGLRAVVYREVGAIDKKDVDRAMREAIADIEDWRAETQGGIIKIGISPYALYTCHPSIFSRIADYASDGTHVAVHLAGSIEEYDFIKNGSSPFSVHSERLERGSRRDIIPWLATGVSPVKYVNNWGLLDTPNIMAIHCVQVDDSDISVLADKNVSIAVCSRCNAQLAMGIVPLKKFNKAKLRVGIGTDSPAASNITDPIDEMRLTLLMQRAFTSGSRSFLKTEDVLRMATLGGAEALMIDDEVGSLDIGKRADLIAVDLSNSHQAPTHDPSSAIVHTANQENVLFTMVDGKVLYDSQYYGEEHRHGIDTERVFCRAEEMRVKLKN